MALIFADAPGAMHTSDETYSPLTAENSSFTSIQADSDATNGYAYFQDSVYYLKYNFNSNTNKIFLSFRFKFNTGAITTDDIVTFSNSSGSQLKLRFDVTSMNFQIRRGTTTIASGSKVISKGVWYSIVLEIKVANTGGIAKLYIDGQLDIDYTGDTQYQSTNDVSVVYFEGTTYNNWFCDVVCWDDTGTVLNSLVHGLKVIYKLPNGAGNYSQWTPSAGSNYQNVDEADCDDDTTYNSTATAGNKDTFTFPNVTEISTVYGVLTFCRVRKDDVGSRTYRDVVRIGTTDYFGTSKSMPTDYETHMEIHETNPNTGSQWTLSEVNSAEFGYELVS